MSTPIRIEKSEDEIQVAWGALYVPGVPDAHGHFMTKEEIQKSYLKFMRKGDLKAFDIMHDGQSYGLHAVEMFLSRKGDPDFPVEGTWVVAAYFPDAVWGMVKKGELNGWSMEALAFHEEDEVDIMTGVLKGKTYKHEQDGHEHEFEVIYDDEGKFLGGRTDVHTDADGRQHFHVIKRGTATEKTLDHHHKFATAELLLEIQS